jgi:hypothetical protein
MCQANNRKMDVAKEFASLGEIAIGHLLLRVSLQVLPLYEAFNTLFDFGWCDWEFELIIKLRHEPTARRRLRQKEQGHTTKKTNKKGGG